MGPLWLILLPVCAHADDGIWDSADQQAFEVAQQEAHAALEPFLERAGGLTQAGDLAGATSALMQAADKANTPAAWYILGNILYYRDPASSLALHQRAVDAWPSNPVLHERVANHLHRKGDCEGALPHYELATSPASRTGRIALQAQCALVVGSIEQATTLWAELDMSRDEATVVQAVERMGRTYDEHAVRADLMQATAKGGREAWLALLLHDTAMRSTAWAYTVDPDLLAADHQAAQAALADDGAMRADLDLLVRAATRAISPVEAGALAAKRYRRTLPAHPAFAERIISWRLASPEFNPADAVKAYGAHLERRIDDGDAGALRLLSALVAAQVAEAARDKDESALARHAKRLFALDTTGCTTHGLARSCGSLMGGGLGSLSAAQVDTWLADRPLDPRIHAFALMHTIERGDTPTEAMLLGYLQNRPRYMGNAMAYDNAMRLLRRMLADDSAPAATLQTLHNSLAHELAAFTGPDCEPWVAERIRESPTCDGSR